jgi:hypothetical protein
MNDPAHQLFHAALRTYEDAALPEIGAIRTLDAVGFIEAVNGCLDGGGVLYATQDDLEAAVRVVLAKDENSDSNELLRVELDRFRDLAITRGGVSHHSKNHEGRDESVGVESVGVQTELPDRQDVARLMTRLVANLIEEGLNSALLLNPVAVPVSELGEEDGVLDQTAEHLSKRWRTLAHRLRKPLGIFRIAFPVVALLFALNSIFSCGGPLGSRTHSAMVTGTAVNEIRKLVRDMDGLKIGDPETIESLQELSERTGRPTAYAARVFRLRRVLYGAVFLEHIETGKMVAIFGEYIGSFDSRGTWRLVK